MSNETEGRLKLSLKPCCHTKKVIINEIKANESFVLEIFLEIIIYYIVKKYTSLSLKFPLFMYIFLSRHEMIKLSSFSILYNGYTISFG